MKHISKNFLIGLKYNVPRKSKHANISVSINCKLKLTFYFSSFVSQIQFSMQQDKLIHDYKCLHQKRKFTLLKVVNKTIKHKRI